jgi:hypothetical protein
MRLPQLQEIIREASLLAARKQFVLFGSQAVHAITKDPPAEVLMSRECDVWLQDEPAVGERLRSNLGPTSPFQQAKGFYLDPLPPDLPVVPKGWEQRLVDLMVDDIRVSCLEIHDLIVSKLGAGRLKDYEFIAAVLMARLAHADEVIERIRTFPDPHTQALLLARLRIATEATDVRL